MLLSFDQLIKVIDHMRVFMFLLYLLSIYKTPPEKGKKSRCEFKEPLSREDTEKPHTEWGVKHWVSRFRVCKGNTESHFFQVLAIISWRPFALFCLFLEFFSCWRSLTPGTNLWGWGRHFYSRSGDVWSLGRSSLAYFTGKSWERTTDIERESFGIFKDQNT